MYELLKEQISNTASNEEKINKLREFLQILILKIMFDNDNFTHLGFVGGTALRIIYGLKRYSEDLDFNLIQKKGYLFDKIINQIKTELEKNNLTIETTINKKNIVHIGYIKFIGMLNELKLSNNIRQKLSIKIEIDSKPPRGWNTEVIPITKSYVFAVKSYDLSSQYAAKLHACLFRKFIKGRDYYDLIWFLGKHIEPNYVLLNNAIKKTEKKDFRITKHNLKEFLSHKIKNIDFHTIKKDISRFVEDKTELKLFNKDLILKIL